MFGSSLRNPLYDLPGGSYGLAFIMAVVAIALGFALLWRNRNFKSATRYFTVGIFMAAVGVDLARVLNAPPMSVTVHPHSPNQSDYDTVLWTRPTLLMTAISVMVVVSFGVMAYRNAKAGRLLSLGASLAAFTAAVTVAVAMFANQFDVGTSVWNGFGRAEDASRDILLVVLVAFGLTVVVTSLLRGVRFIRQRRNRAGAATDASLAEEPVAE